ncbi:bacterial alpha-L-rhamnosidase-domain-containing protein [Mycena rebaudengoi]|nr:bacterial alpha-L-rhamnosidase-domain-containing protein [Mycena rebaudengoi]
MRLGFKSTPGTSLLLLAGFYGLVNAQVSVTSLQVENKISPIGIDVIPRFSWITTSSTRGASQTAYQLKVSTTAAGASDVWDSGLVSSSIPYLVQYAGPALKSDTKYFWTVAVTTTAGSSSASSSFTTGMLTQQDWSPSVWIGKDASVISAGLSSAFNAASWIWTAESAPPNSPAGDRAFRFTFTSPSGKTAKSAVVVVTADDRFSLFVNGVLAGSSPNTTDIWKVAQIFRVSLSASGNLFAVRATNLPDVATGGAGPAGLIMAAQVTFTDGTTSFFSSDATWRGTATIPTNFQSPTLDDSSWARAVSLGKYSVAPWGTSVVIAAPTPSVPSLTKSNWIWSAAAASAPPGDVAFRKTFTAAAGKAPASATIIMTVDDRFTLYLNGVLVGASPNEADVWRSAQQFHVTLNSATNLFAVRATNIADVSTGGPSPAGFLAAISILYTDGSSETVISDTTWKATTNIPTGFELPSTSDASWASAASLGVYGVAPWNTDVSVSDPLGEHPAPLLRKSFTISKDVASARLFYSAGGYAATQYVGLDVASRLVRGENVISAEMGRSHYGVTQGSVWNWAGAPWRGEPALRSILSITFTDGTQSRIVSDSSWKVIEGPTRLDDIFGGENFDASFIVPGYDKAGFDDSSWNAALVTTGPAGVLVNARQPPTKIIGSMAPVSIKAVQGSYVVAFPRVVAGWAKITVTGPAKTLITVHFGEKLNSDGTVQYQDTQHYYSNNFQTDRFWLAGTGAPETFEPKFSYKGYQYVQLFGWPGAAPTAANIVGQIVHDDLAPRGGFQSSNDLLNKLHIASVLTMLNNIAPHLRKMDGAETRWFLQTYLNPVQEMFLTNLDSTDLLAKYVRDLQDTLNGGPPAVIGPDSGWGANNQAPTWQHMFNSNCEDHPTTSRRRDWETGLHHYTMFDTMSTIATVLGNAADATSFANQAAAIKTAFNNQFLDRATGHYIGQGDSGYRQSHNLLALAFGLVPNATQAQIPREPSKHRSAEYEANSPVLSAHGHADTAFAVATQTTFPSWGFWIANGATTMWEHYSVEARSHDHMFLGTFEDWLYKYVLGIQSTSVAFQTVSIKPAFVNSGSLTSASGWMLTPYGNLTVSWANINGAANINVGVPLGVTANIQFSAKEVSEGGTALKAGTMLKDGRGVTVASQAGEDVIVSVDSGQYSFVAK